MKVCTQCKQKKSLEEFYAGNGEFARHSACKSCYETIYRKKKKKGYPEGCYDPNETRWFYDTKVTQPKNIQVMKEHRVP